MKAQARTPHTRASGLKIAREPPNVQGFDSRPPAIFRQKPGVACLWRRSRGEKRERKEVAQIELSVSRFAPCIDLAQGVGPRRAAATRPNARSSPLRGGGLFVHRCGRSLLEAALRIGGEDLGGREVKKMADVLEGARMRVVLGCVVSSAVHMCVCSYGGMYQVRHNIGVPCIVAPQPALHPDVPSLGPGLYAEFCAVGLDPDIRLDWSGACDRERERESKQASKQAINQSINQASKQA